MAVSLFSSVQKGNSGQIFRTCSPALKYLGKGTLCWNGTEHHKFCQEAVWFPLLVLLGHVFVLRSSQQHASQWHTVQKCPVAAQSCVRKLPLRGLEIAETLLWKEEVKAFGGHANNKKFKSPLAFILGRQHGPSRQCRHYGNKIPAFQC